MSLDGRCTNGKLFVTSILNEMCYRMAIPKDNMDKKPYEGSRRRFSSLLKMWVSFSKVELRK